MTVEKLNTILNKLNVKYNLLKTWESNQYKLPTKFINFILYEECMT